MNHYMYGVYAYIHYMYGFTNMILFYIINSIELSMLFTDCWRPGRVNPDLFYYNLGVFMELKQPLSFDQQIEMLISHNMIISNYEDAKKILETINYYRFTGYALEFRKSISDSDYLDNTYFHKILEIYNFDEKLRILLLEYLLKIEIYYRTQISNGFSLLKCNITPHNQHYNFRNYYNTNGIQKVFESIDREIYYHRDSDIVRHHNDRYNKQMPLWVLVELISFSNLSKFYSALYYDDQIYIAKKVGHNSNNLSNWLHCLSVLRNVCAHGGRLYNKKFNPPTRLTRSFLRNNPDVINDTLFAYIITIKRMLPLENDKTKFVSELINLISDYKDSINLDKIGFTQNYIEILNRV